MILKNNTAKGKFFAYKLNGIPFKVWIEAYSEFDMTTLDERFGQGKKLEDIAVEDTGDFGINLDSHSYSLIKNMERGKLFPNLELSDVVAFSGGDGVDDDVDDDR